MPKRWSVDKDEELHKEAASLFGAGWRAECLAYGDLHVQYRLTFGGRTIDILVNFEKKHYQVSERDVAYLPFSNTRDVRVVGGVLWELHDLTLKLGSSSVTFFAA